MSSRSAVQRRDFSRQNASAVCRVRVFAAVKRNIGLPAVLLTWVMPHRPTPTIAIRNMSNPLDLGAKRGDEVLHQFGPRRRHALAFGGQEPLGDLEQLGRE